MNADLLYERRGDIGWVTFNRPQARNALTFAMYEGLAAICAEANKTRDVKALVITGAGDKAFAAGTDIAQFKAFQGGEDGIGYERKMDHMLETIERCAVPTIAAIASPPRKCPTKALAAPNSARLIPASLANMPIRMNSGMTDRE